MPPRLAIVSTNTRRDLQDPLKFFTRLEVLHLYQRAEYADLTPEDWSEHLFQYSTPRMLYSQLVRCRPDVIQGVEPFSIPLLPYLYACSLAARRTHARLLIVTPENCPLESKYGWLAASALYAALRPVLAQAGMAIVLNQGARRNLERFGVPPPPVAQLLWGTWGVDTTEFSPAKDSPGRNKSDPLLLFVGRLHPEKGVFVLLDAFVQIQRVFPAVRLTIIGDGPARAEIETRILNMRGVSLLGTVKNRALPDHFRQAKVFVSPSLTTRKWQEQIGMTNLQAMACGVPIVSTHSGAIPEYVPDGIAGHLVREGDAGALADAICKLMTNPGEAQAMGHRGREFALAHYEVRSNIARAEQRILDWLQ